MSKKRCIFCKEQISEIDFTDKEKLSKFLSESGAILPIRRTHLCAKHQRQMKKAVKRARSLGLLPFVLE